MANAEDVLNVARRELGYSRWDDPLPGTKYGRWYAIDHGEYYGHSGVAFCAMFVSWVLNQAAVPCIGIPGAYCPYIVRDLRRAGAALGAHDGRPGDIILFDWNHDGVADHIGFVEVNHGSYYTTIEGNTLNGRVARRNRSFGDVVCCGRPNYSGGSIDIPDDGSLSVDGWAGPNTVRKWQEVLGTETDGVISGQGIDDRPYHVRLVSVSYEGDGDSQLAKKVQEIVGVDVDGYIGPNTISAIQSRLGTDTDGYFGPNTARSLQERLNTGSF